MTAFDTDVLSDLAKNVSAIIVRASAVPLAEQSVPIVVAEEVMRGQLSTIRRAQTGVGRISLEQAYDYFQEALSVLRNLQFLPYTTVAHALFQAWRAAKIRVGTQDLRIAAICVAHGATLVTRNARDYSQIPGLILDVWN